MLEGSCFPSLALTRLSTEMADDDRTIEQSNVDVCWSVEAYVTYLNYMIISTDLSSTSLWVNSVTDPRGEGGDPP